MKVKLKKTIMQYPREQAMLREFIVNEASRLDEFDHQLPLHIVNYIGDQHRPNMRAMIKEIVESIEDHFDGEFAELGLFEKRQAISLAFYNEISDMIK